MSKPAIGPSAVLFTLPPGQLRQVRLITYHIYPLAGIYLYAGGGAEALAPGEALKLGEALTEWARAALAQEAVTDFTPKPLPRPEEKSLYRELCERPDAFFPASDL